MFDRVQRLLVLGAVTAIAGACGLSVAGGGASVDDASVPLDAFASPDSTSADGNTIVNDSASPIEGGSTDAASDTGTIAAFCTTSDFCNNCDAGAGVYAVCEGSKSCVASCGSCSGAPYQCYSCYPESKGGPLTVAQTCAGTQTYNGQTFLGCPPYGGCACTKASDCPGETQVCVTFKSQFGSYSSCETCGEQGSSGQACKSGKTCNAATYTCE